MVTTHMDRHTSPKLILCLGPWACERLTDLGLPLSGRRIPIIHFEPKDRSRYDGEAMPVYFWAAPEGIFAGFPYFDGEGVKIMRHDRSETCTPSTVRRDIDAADVEEVSQFADRVHAIRKR